jgi:hypothetical protein
VLFQTSSSRTCELIQTHCKIVTHLQTHCKIVTHLQKGVGLGGSIPCISQPEYNNPFISFASLAFISIPNNDSFFASLRYAYLNEYCSFGGSSYKDLEAEGGGEGDADGDDAAD